MSHLIPESFLDALKSRLELKEVIQSYGVTLKKSGRNHFGLCPFHNEKSPSFSVNNDKQFYYCFGCGATGHAISFVSEHTGISFRDAVKQLASQVGMDIPKNSTSKSSAADNAKRAYKKKLEAIMESAASWFQVQLTTHAGAEAKHYLQHVRKLSENILNQYGVGYAPDQWSALKDYLLAQGYTEQMLIDSGMLTVNDDQNNSYDRFRNRVMFPIRDTRGKVIAFGGRVLDDSKPKYLNSPETQLYKKSFETYGLLEARRNTRNLNRLLIVEGYTDVLALADAGITYAAAPLGTSITEQQIDKLMRSSNALVFCFDGDDAGQKAALRTLEIITPKMINARDISFMFMPAGKDPDEMLSILGASGFSDLIDSGLPALDYILNISLGDLNLEHEGDKVTYARQVAEWLHKMPQSLHAVKLLKVVCGKTGLTENEVLSSVQKTVKSTLMNLPDFNPIENKNFLLLKNNFYTLFTLLWAKPGCAKPEVLSDLSKSINTLMTDIKTKESSEATKDLERIANNIESLIKSIEKLLEIESNRIYISQSVLHYYWYECELLNAVEVYKERAKENLLNIPEKPDAAADMIESAALFLIKKAGEVDLSNNSSELTVNERFAQLRAMKVVTTIS